MGLPVVAFYLNGEKKAELTGGITPEQVEAKINELLG
jgi:thiol:disulfide interchange protein